LQNCVSALRRVFADAGVHEPVIVADGQSYCMRPAAGALDAEIFAAEVTAATRHAQNGDTERAAAGLLAALNRWRGPALLGLSGRIVEAAAARLNEQRLAAVEQRFELELGLGRHREVIGELSDLVTANPLRERLVGHLLVALSRSGRQAEAVHVYQRLRKELADELGIDPGAAVQQIYTSILASETEEARPATRPQRPVPAQLPTDVSGFTGRAEHLTALDEVLAEPASAVAVAAIAGMAGIGKTALAVHWAHRVRARFPDGQLFVNLSGHGPAAPLSAGRVLQQFLTSLGVPAEQVPSDVEAAAGLFRSTVAGRRLLVVLDNARDVAQVLPLLPGQSGCVVLVTSRDQLGGLATVVGATMLTLDVVTAGEARDILAHRIGAARVAGDGEAVERILARCARLPLALAIVGARAAVRPGFSLRAVADELTDAQDRLGAFDAGTPAADLSAVLSWSYQRLDPPGARLFRLLGLHAGPDIDVVAAASLVGEPVARTRRALAELTRVHLAAEPAPGRFQRHDLVHAYSAELCDELEPAAEQHAALHRLLDHYMHTALAADKHVDPSMPPQDDPAPVEGALVVEFPDATAASAWFTVERLALMAAVDVAWAHGFDRHVWRLARAITPFLDGGGHWREAIPLQQTGIAAASRAGDAVGAATLHRAIAMTHTRIDGFDEAVHHYQEAVRLYREVGDRTGEAYAHLNTGGVYEAQRRFREAVTHVEAGLALFDEAGEERAAGFAYSGLAHLHAELGEHERALAYCEQALAPERGVGDMVRAAVLDSRGQALHHLGDHEAAVASFEESVRFLRTFPHPLYLAQVLANLGDTHLAAGDPNACRAAWQEAAQTFDLLYDARPAADEVRAKLLLLDGGVAPVPSSP
jgi:DNA-binding SARP family transcriptional activator